MPDYIKDLTEVRIKTPLGSYKTPELEMWALKSLEDTQTNAGAILKKIARMHRIPYTLALPFCATESGGKSVRAADGLSYGIMQCNAATLDGVIKFALAWGMKMGEFKYLFYKCRNAFKVISKPEDVPPLVWPPLPLVNLPVLGDVANSDEQNRRDALDDQLARNVVKYVNYAEIIPTGTNGASPSNKYNRLMLSDKEFATHVGCMYLYQLLTRSIVKEKGNEYGRVDWVINGYNAGYYRKENPWINPNQENLSPDVWFNQGTVPSVTKMYVRKLCGVGGYLDLIKQGKFKLV